MFLVVLLVENKKFFEDTLILIPLGIFAIVYLIFIYKVTKILKYYKRTKINPFLMIAIHILIPLSIFFIVFYLWIKGNDLILSFQNKQEPSQ